MIEVNAKDLYKVLIGNKTMLKSLEAVRPGNKGQTKARKDGRGNGRKL